MLDRSNLERIATAKPNKEQAACLSIDVGPSFFSGPCCMWLIKSLSYCTYRRKDMNSFDVAVNDNKTEPCITRSKTALVQEMNEKFKFSFTQFSFQFSFIQFSRQ